MGKLELLGHAKIKSTWKNYSVKKLSCFSAHVYFVTFATLFFTFLWNGKGDKIKRDIMISEYEDRGLKMIDIRLFTQALKLNWVKKYLQRKSCKTEAVFQFTIKRLRRRYYLQR